jgi:hypothetical protein
MLVTIHFKAEDAEEEKLLKTWQEIYFHTYVQEFLESEGYHHCDGVFIEEPRMVYEKVNGEIIPQFNDKV